MDYDYDVEERYESRILWGRIGVYGVALLLMFLLGSCWGARGEADEAVIADLEGRVAALTDENDQLREQIDALSATASEDTTPDPGEPDTEDDGETDGSRTYIVQSGDTLTTIAREFYDDSTQWEVIADANNLTRDTPLTVGQELVIPPLDEANGNDEG